MAAQQLALDYARGGKPPSIMEMPYPIREAEDWTPHARTGYVAHRCGLKIECDGWRLCLNSRCSLPEAYPCAKCTAAVEASYKPGRYCSR